MLQYIFQPFAANAVRGAFPPGNIERADEHHDSAQCPSFVRTFSQTPAGAGAARAKLEDDEMHPQAFGDGEQVLRAERWAVATGRSEPVASWKCLQGVTYLLLLTCRQP
jgi:hypothetical protein